MVWVGQIFAYSIFLKITIIYLKVTFLNFYFKVRYVWKTHGENIFGISCWKGKYLNAHILFFIYLIKFYFIYFFDLTNFCSFFFKLGTSLLE